MKKLLLSLLMVAAFAFGCVNPAEAVTRNWGATALTGGGTGALDKIDGNLLTDLDAAFVNILGTTYIYTLDDDSAAAESSPDVIAPDTNAGNKRWLLQQVATEMITSSGDVTKVGTPVDNQVGVWTGDGTIEGDANLTWSGTELGITGSETIVGTQTADIIVIPSPAAQSITAVTDQINAENNSHFGVTSDADYVMTSTPTIADGIDGQILYLHNTGTFTIDLQDESVLTGSNILTDGADGTLKIDSIMMMLFSSDESAWLISSNPNTASAGANADTLDVRNSSGGAISAGQAVYISGWNVGQARAEIALADADGAGTHPAIGVASAAISNNANGTVITFGNAANIIDTSSASVGDGVWLSTTAGAVVFTRPTIDGVQRLGTVARSHASAGVVVVTGAGRENDTPIIIPDLTTATTQSALDNSTKLATTAYADAVGGVGTIPAFSVHKNGSDQTGVVSGVWTILTWATELFDTNNDFASNRFTPTVAGKYLINSFLQITIGVDGANLLLGLYKNGVIHKRGLRVIWADTGQTGNCISTIVEANGSTDFFEIFVNQDTGGDKVISGGTATTYFEGFKIAE